METIKVKRGHVKRAVTRILTFCDDISPEVSIEALRVRLDRLDAAWAEFCDLQNQLCEHHTDPLFTDQDTEYEQFEQKYFRAKELLLQALKNNPSTESDAIHRMADQQNSFFERFSSTITSASPSRTMDIALPKLEIPYFQGNYSEWISFRDLFNATVHNNLKLSDSQKLQYLKGLLRGEAAALLRHLSITDANYQQAWECLKSRYENTGLIVNSFIKSFLSLPSISSPSFAGLRKLTDGTDEVLRGLKALGNSAEACDPWIIYLLLNKIDVTTRQSWFEHTTSRECTTINDLITFLNTRCRALEECQPASRNQPVINKYHETRFNVKSHTSSFEQCPKCHQQHVLFRCIQFQKLNIDDRRLFVNKNNLCYNCLRIGHNSAHCKSKNVCNHCQQRHHTLVHRHDPSNSAYSSTKIQSQNKEIRHGDDSKLSSNSTNHIHSTQASLDHKITSSRSENYIAALLPTALVHVFNYQDHPYPCRILLDSGSQASFITESFVQRLGLRRNHAKLSVSGLSSSTAGITRGVVTIKMQSRLNNTTIDVNAFILTKLTSHLPTTAFQGFPQLNTLKLADPTYNEPNPIDIILGVDHVFQILDKNQFMIKNNLFAQLTQFGWVVAGKLPVESSNVLATHANVKSFQTEIDIDASLKLFWEIEESSLPSKMLTSDEEEAERIFTSTTTRANDGRYIVELPFKSPQVHLGISHAAAASRLRAMERRFSHNPELKSLYHQFMDEYAKLNHMTEITANEIQTNHCYYLPHHAVVKVDSTTTKLRVVFDGSAKTSNSFSLNDALLIGPAIQKDLVSVCIRFRMHRYTFTADIEKMYRQIWVADRHHDFQRILWRSSPELPMRYYRLRTVTYGTASAPFLAIRVLNQLAKDNVNTYPLAAKVLLTNCYVDDILTGSESIECLTQIKNELISLLSSAGFKLKKWSSNCKEILQSIPPEECDFTAKDLTENMKSIKTLGLKWFPSSDTLSYSTSPMVEALVTKRMFLSCASRMFDPLGLLTPVTISIKTLFQSLWLMKVDWDDPIPNSIASQWLTIQNELIKLQELQIPRWIGYSRSSMELHGFSDASESAYAAVIYSRFKSTSGLYCTQLVIAKSKVAPLKQISIARLELCGCLLLSRLFKRILNIMDDNDCPVTAWTDSTIVLHWLSSQPRRWTTFIANRTSEILSTLPTRCWKYVPSQQNPADCASRGISPTALLNHSLWWHGPSWLQQSSPVIKEQWTTPSPNSELLTTEEKQSRMHALTTKLDTSMISVLCLKYSKWYKLIRIIAYCLRFIHNASSINQPKQTEWLKTDELQKAKLIILKHTQHAAFSNEIHHLRNKTTLSSHDQLKRLFPFIDNIGLLRVGGRLKHSELPYDTKHPIILPRNTHITRLIVSHYHIKFCHAGANELFTLLREEFWIIGCRNIIRKLIYSCQRCFRYRRESTSQLMGQLPQVRVRRQKPFSYTGCDYAGPIRIRCFRGRNPRFTKGYICIFVCMSTKAIHLELASELTTESFLACLRRFIARRGRCSHIFSDNATNFKGASRTLSEMHQLLLSKMHNCAIQNELSQEGVQWSFNPPNSPHFGGLWEAGVKSVKTHLKRVIGDHALTFEEFYTVLTQIEAVLNSRPLFGMPGADFEALTPFHLLVGHSYRALPEPLIPATPSHLLSNWKLLESMVQGFWKRWHAEYLTSLQQRPKWQTVQTNLQVGDIVLIKEKNLPAAKWPLAKIMMTHPGQDGHTRVVTLKTSSGTFTRPIVKLIRLPMPETEHHSSGPQDVTKCAV